MYEGLETTTKTARKKRGKSGRNVTANSMAWHPHTCACVRGELGRLDKWVGRQNGGRHSESPPLEEI
jgi:hypothetical protein